MTHAAQIEAGTAEKIAEELTTAEAIIATARPHEAKEPNAAFWALVEARATLRGINDLTRYEHPAPRHLADARERAAYIMALSKYWMN